MSRLISFGATRANHTSSVARTVVRAAATVRSLRLPDGPKRARNDNQCTSDSRFPAGPRAWTCGFPDSVKIHRRGGLILAWSHAAEPQHS